MMTYLFHFIGVFISLTVSFIILTKCGEIFCSFVRVDQMSHDPLVSSDVLLELRK